MAPSRNNRGVAHENGSTEGPHGHQKRAIADALLLRGTSDFGDLAAYRRFLDEFCGRRNAHNRKRIEAERGVLQPCAGGPRQDAALSGGVGVVTVG